MTLATSCRSLAKLRFRNILLLGAEFWWVGIMLGTGWLWAEEAKPVMEEQALAKAEEPKVEPETVKTSPEIAMPASEEQLPLDLDETAKPEKSPIKLGPDKSIYQYGLKIGLSLAVVLALMIGVLAMLRRGMGLSKSGKSGPHMKIAQRLALNAKQSIYLVEVGKRMLVIGGSPDRLETLTEITDPEELRNSSGAGFSAGFVDELKQAGDPYSKNWQEDAIPADAESPSEGVETLRAEIARIRSFVHGFKNQAST